MNSTKNRLICIGKHNVFEARFSLFIFLSFPMGKLDILKSENRVLKTMCFQIQMTRPNDKKVIRTGHFYLKTHGFQNAIFTSRHIEL